MSATSGGAFKVDVAHRHLRSVNRWSAISTVPADVGTLTPGCFTGCTVALVAVDNERARLLATRLLRAAEVPYVDVGVRADLAVARATVISATASAACLCCNWPRPHLARAGVDVGMPCDAVVESGDGFPSTLVMGQAAAALGAHQALALAGVVPEKARVGEEIRLDLTAMRLSRFDLPTNHDCAADHALAGGRTALVVSPADVTLGALLASCGIRGESTVVVSAEIVTRAFCQGCRHVGSPYARLSEPACCDQCGAPSAPLRRTTALAWDAVPPALHAEPASRWLKRGDVFAIVDADETRVYALAAPPLPADLGLPWDATAAERFVRLPRTLDLERVRSTRLAIIGLGNVGAAALAQLAPLPWKGVVLADRDQLAQHNLQAHALAASAGGDTA